MNEATATAAPEVAPGKPSVVEVSDDGKVYFCLDGERYEVLPPNPLEELQILRQRATAARRDPVESVKPLLETLNAVAGESRAEMVKALANRLYDDVMVYAGKKPATPDEIAAYLDSEDGGALTAWFRLRGNPNVDEPKAAAIVKRVGLAVWLQQRDRMSQELITYAKRVKAEAQAARAAAEKPGEKPTEKPTE